MLWQTKNINRHHRRLLISLQQRWCCTSSCQHNSDSLITHPYHPKYNANKLTFTIIWTLKFILLTSANTQSAAAFIRIRFLSRGAKDAFQLILSFCEYNPVLILWKWYRWRGSSTINWDWRLVKWTDMHHVVFLHIWISIPFMTFINTIQNITEENCIEKLLFFVFWG